MNIWQDLLRFSPCTEGLQNLWQYKTIELDSRNVWNWDFFSKSDLHTRRQCSSVGGQLEGAKEVQGKFSSKKMAQKWCRDGSLMILIWPVKTKVEPPFVKGGRKFCTLSPLDIFGKNKGPLMCCWACALWVKSLRI